MWNVSIDAINNTFPWLTDEEANAVLVSARGRQNEILKQIPLQVLVGEWDGALFRERPKTWSRSGVAEEGSAQAVWLKEAKEDNQIPVRARCVHVCVPIIHASPVLFVVVCCRTWERWRMSPSRAKATCITCG